MYVKPLYEYKMDLLSAIQSDEERRIDITKKSVKLATDFASNSYKSLYLNNEKADVFFVCGAEKKRIPAHKLILSEASDIFDKMFYRKSAKKCNTTVSLPNASPEAFQDFLQLFYLDEISFGLANITQIVDLTVTYHIPNQRLLYELNYAPVQGSSKHILNALNDDCIQEILRKLQIEDYLNAANVCTRFRNNAIAAYPQEYKSLYIDNYWKYHDNVIDQTFAVKFLGIFGSLVQSINCNAPMDHKFDDDFPNIIADLCGKSLIEFGYTNDHLNFNTRSPFQSLEKLELDAVDVSNFNLYSQLTSLELIGSSNLDFMRPFPKLEEAVFSDMNLTENQLAKFLESNPQLKRLVLFLKQHPTPLMYAHIVNFGLNLESFSTNVEEGDCEEIMKLSELRKLKKLELYHIGSVPLNRLILLFVKNDVRIEELDISSVHLNDTQNITKLKNLKNLTIGEVSEKTLTNIVKDLPKLKKIATTSQRITAKGIIKTLNVGKNLIEFCFYPLLELNLKEYNEILELAIGRTKVKIFRLKGEIPQDVLNSNRKWVDIHTVEA